MKTTITFKVKDLITGWTSLPHTNFQEASEDLIRLRDRVGMQVWKNAPERKYVVVKEETTVSNTLINY